MVENTGPLNVQTQMGAIHLAVPAGITAGMLALSYRQSDYPFQLAVFSSFPVGLVSWFNSS